MNTIVAVDKNWAIGNQGELLFHISEDMKQFREKTTGNVVILGRKTLETFPGGRPLKNRTNIILSRNPDFEAGDAVVVHDTEELLAQCRAYDDETLFVIGGDSVYRLLLPYCSRAYVTYVEQGFEADAYFPNLEENGEWELVEESEKKTCEQLVYSFRVYERKSAVKDEK